MLIKVLKGKLHRATVTKAKLHYPGSIAIDSALLDASGIIPYENVLIADLDNGNRLETYAVPAAAGSGRIEILGAATWRGRRIAHVVATARTNDFFSSEEINSSTCDKPLCPSRGVSIPRAISSSSEPVPLPGAVRTRTPHFL